MQHSDPFDFLSSPGVYLSQREEIARKLNLIIKIRWFVSPIVFLILWIASLFGISVERELSLLPVLLNTSIILGLNSIYKLLLKRLKDLRPLVYFQLFLDALHFTLTIYQTGGITSPFSFLYLGVILASAILVSRAATTYSVLISILLYSLLIGLEATGVLKHNNVFIPLTGMENIRSYLVLTWLFNITSIIVIALFSTFLFSEIHNQQLALRKSNKALHNKIANFMLLYKTSQAINNSPSINHLIDYILTELLNFLNLDRALLYLVKDNSCLRLFMLVHRHNDSSSALDEEIAPGNLEIPLQEEAGLTAITALTGRAVNITNPEDSPLINRELARKIGMNPFAMAPLTVNKQTLGVLGIDRNLAQGAITPEEFKILKIFANQAAIALQCFRRTQPEKETQQ